MKSAKIEINSTDTAKVLSLWQGLSVFAAYRFFLALVLFFVFYSQLPPDFLGESNPELYYNTSQLYFLIAVVFLVVTTRHWGNVETQTKIQLLIDVGAIMLFIHASGGLKSGLGLLLAVIVAAAGALAPGRPAIFIAAIATISVLLEAAFSQIIGDGGITRYSHAGMLGAAFFATVILAEAFNSRVRAIQELAEQHAGDASKLSMLNRHIIEQLQVGVMIVDKDNIVYLTNQSAHVLLGVTDSIKGEHLSAQLPELFGQLGHWKHGRTGSVHEFQPQAGFAEILPKMTALEDGDTLILLSDTTELTRQAQQMKLASLGRMAASIAHEVRNPLGAISHATELLNEADGIEEKDHKLLDIIQRQSNRVNEIIESVLQLSRRKILNKETFLLAPWLEHCVEELRHNERIPETAMKLDISASLAQVRVDQEQLRQIMVNLCSNAWHYSDEALATDSEPQVLVRMRTTSNEIFIEVLDNGPGVSETALPQLFEPFYSERTGGVGLGLFLSREMAQANGVRLDYINEQDKKGYFRVTFDLKLEGKV